MKKEYKRRMLGFRIFSLLLIIGLTFDIALTLVGGIMYTKNMKDTGRRICAGISDTVAQDIDTENVKRWAEGEKQKEYSKIEENLENLINSFPDLRRIEVCRVYSGGLVSVFDINDESKTNKTPGAILHYDERIPGIRERVLSGEDIDGIFTEKNGERTVVSYTPRKDKNGNTACYVICEISMEEMSVSRDKFVLVLFLAVVLVTIILVIVAYICMRKVLVKPLSGIDKNLRVVAADNSTGAETVEKLKKIDCKNIIEIEKIRDNFISLADEVSIKSNEVREFDKMIAARMKEELDEESTLVDSLTEDK